MRALWKPAVLACSLVATLFGYLMRPEAGVEPSQVQAQPGQGMTTTESAVPVVTLAADVRGGGAYRGMPQRPVFQAPVTRTRRS